MLQADEFSHLPSTVILSHYLLKPPTMNSSLFLAVLLCLVSVKADMGDDGQWIDDVSGNPIVMGMVDGHGPMMMAQPPAHHAPMVHSADGQWVDDVSGNPVVMGMVAGPPAPQHAPMVHSADGQWVDDVSGNPVVMGMVAGPPAPHHAPVVHSADGQWVDDVSGNIVAMGMDSRSQDSGWTGNNFFWAIILVD